MSNKKEEQVYNNQDHMQHNPHKYTKEQLAFIKDKTSKRTRSKIKPLPLED